MPTTPKETLFICQVYRSAEGHGLSRAADRERSENRIAMYDKLLTHEWVWLPYYYPWLMRAWRMQRLFTPGPAGTDGVSL